LYPAGLTLISVTHDNLEILKIIKSLKPKDSSGYDEISTKL